ncbi:hypothetical protein SKAU_G00359890 [Synaphobranchus kaupii]|uniref:Uncharacterized protein n=1 Tax=Synaphobranchus kaupii TaxID=118154 RepID=A0A9Q1EI37_SYNKA|nr:hypothetical protein SKAU_G00359890 [Synaphobranchus kaupii]
MVNVTVQRSSPAWPSSYPVAQWHGHRGARESEERVCSPLLRWGGPLGEGVQPSPQVQGARLQFHSTERLLQQAVRGAIRAGDMLQGVP